MLKDLAVDYFMNKDCNCAEATLHAISDYYHLDFPEISFRMMSGYGGGFCYGLACGTLCSAMAAISSIIVKTCAHQTEEYLELSKKFVSMYDEYMKGTSCETLKELYHNGVRCTKTVELAGEVIEEFFDKYLVDQYLRKET